MTSTTFSSWNKGEHSALISIGTHRLYVSASGQKREAGEPAILLMTGLSSTISEWVAVRRLVTPFARWMEYDRSGLGRSESPPDVPDAITAVDVAIELDVLLTNAGIEGPFLVVCHSWGGMTAREFLHLRSKDIAGIVFVDANTEDTYDGGKWPASFMGPLSEGLNWNKVTGLTASRVLSDEEWEAVKKELKNPRHKITEAAEQRGYPGDAAILAAKRQIENQALGNRPISIIKANTARDFERVYHAGVAAGNGNEEQRAAFRKYLVTFGGKWKAWQERLQQLSNVNRFVETDVSGHNVEMQEPELIAGEIRWALGLIRGSLDSSPSRRKRTVDAVL